ncbi:MAG TPA: ABC transporter permease [Chloroflexia bacterium]|nr:ABC transporter permease [Chloroflexia bacterium]
MTAFLIRRLIQGVVVLVISTAIIYFVLTLIPGGPLTGFRAPGAKISPGQVNRLGYLMGINDLQGHPYPWYSRYFNWLFTPGKKGGIDVTIAGVRIFGAGLLTGDTGRSITYATGQGVTDLIGERLPFTLILMVTSLIVSLIIALPVGIISAVKQYSRLDYSITLLTFFGISMPTFWFGWMLIILFAYYFQQWGWPHLPPSLAFDPGMESDIPNRLLHLVMPVTVLSLIQVAGWSRFLRSSMLEVLRLDYVRTAWAKGLKQRIVILRHALRNALIPLITVISLSIPGLFGGAIITESIFSYPGMGSLFYNALGAYDWPIVMAFLLISSVLIISANILADVLYAVADPRIRYS